MKLLVSFLVFCLALMTSEARYKKDPCGLNCYRYGKCMGVIKSGKTRPGQLGDTGILVLRTCSQFLKDCECQLPGETTTTTTTSTTTRKPSTRRSLYRPRHRRFRLSQRF